MDLDDTTALLARTPRVLSALLDGLSNDWTRRTDGPGTWSGADIVGHLLHGDVTNWVPRLTTIRRYGPARPFEPFDRVAMLGWEREPIDALLRRFAATRAEALDGLAALDLGAEDLGRQGAHPEFGHVTVGQVLAAWVVHDLTHLAQVAEVLARRHREAVGPYRRYMPALDRVAEAE